MTTFLFLEFLSYSPWWERMIGYSYMKKNIVIRLGLDRPLVCFDTETTGLSITADRIVELAYIKHFPDGREPVKETLRFNPGMPIPKAASDVHGITDEDVADCPKFYEKAADLFEVFKDCAYSGFNVINYDLPLLRQEFVRAGFGFDYRAIDVIDSKIVYHAMEPRTLSSAYKYYCNAELHDAHGALADATAAAEVLSAQVERYGAEKIAQIHAESAVDYVDVDGKFYWKDGQACFSFSKFKHQPLAKVYENEPTFLQWMLNADFSDETKEIVRNALKGKFPTRS